MSGAPFDHIGVSINGEIYVRLDDVRPLHAEVDRLREALRQITMAYEEPDRFAETADLTMYEAARTALEAAKKGARK